MGNIQPGSIIGFSGSAAHNALINLGTYGIPGWSLSHVGIIACGPCRKPLLFESLFSCEEPCEILGRQVSGTQAHTLQSAIERSSGPVWHYPLYRELYDHEDKRLSDFLVDTIGTPYDYMGAFRSAGIGLSWIESLFRRQDMTKIFCSEWVMAAYAFIGLHANGNVSRWNPNRLTRRLRRYGVLLKPERLQ